MHVSVRLSFGAVCIYVSTLSVLVGENYMYVILTAASTDSCVCTCAYALYDVEVSIIALLRTHQNWWRDGQGTLLVYLLLI